MNTQKIASTHSMEQVMKNDYFFGHPQHISHTKSCSSCFMAKQREDLGTSIAKERYISDPNSIRNPLE